MAQVIKDKQDMTHLSWTHIRSSSGTAGSFLKATDDLREPKVSKIFEWVSHSKLWGMMRGLDLRRDFANFAWLRQPQTTAACGFAPKKIIFNPKFRKTGLTAPPVATVADFIHP